MGTRRIPDGESRTVGYTKWVIPRCTHPEHNPPCYFSPPPGIYEHQCPRCGYTTTFRVNEVRMNHGLVCL